MTLSTPLTDAGRVYKMYAKRLEKLGITQMGDFLLHIPSRYDDFSLISKIAAVQPGEVVTIQGEILEIKNEFTKRYKKLQKAKVKDETGIIDILWFNQMFLTRALQVGNKISLSGRIEQQGNKIMMVSPMYEVLDESGKSIHTGRFVPIYPETAGISSKWLRKQVYMLLQNNLSELEEYLPSETVKRLEMYDYLTALKQIHFPDVLENSIKARERLAFDEVFLLQMASKKRRQEWQEKLHGQKFEIKQFQINIQDFFDKLPFILTSAQKRAIEEIFDDLTKNQPMNRLLEGDVGSGKTIVAATAMYLAFLNGFQSVLMAPTEILAQQHYETIKNFLEVFGVKVILQTGSKKGLHPVIASKTKQSNTPVILSNSEESNSKNKILKQIQDDNGSSSRLRLSRVQTKNLNNNSFDILIGTHAVLSDKIHFDKLGLVVIDEQQRFGVEQRALIKEKGNNPHLLTMTATPIPRTVALALYGDLELSILDEMPKGRKEIKTWLVPSLKRDGAYTWIGDQVKSGDQIFIVCPFIEESENMTTVKAAKVEFERLQKHIFPHLKLALLHGKMKSKEKDVVLEDFRNKKYDILVATPVVEVGIDIPNATVIVIEAADRFGLSQLHQLRGRVGRGDKQSYCLLFTEANNPQTTQRLKALETMHNGASLAELDLQMRGSGELYGTLQHGRKWLKIASFGDFTLIERAKIEANSIFPRLNTFPLLKAKVEATNIKQVNPD